MARFTLLASLLAAATLLGGCGTEVKAKFPVTEVPACNDIKIFGNGATCDDGPALTVCGPGKGRACASGWLCFDAPELAFCGCSVDEDCIARSAYINTARASRKMAPLADRCVGGRCKGAP